MKITHVLPALTKGGGEKVVADLACHAAQIGHEVTIIAAWFVDPVQLRNKLHPDIRVYYLSVKKQSKLFLYLSIFPWLLRHRSWLGKQDILHCHLTYGAVFGTCAHLFRTILRSRLPAIVETCHSVGMPIPKWNRWLYAKMAARFDAFALMAEDDFWGAFIKNRPALPSAIIPNGISSLGLVKLENNEKLKYRHEIGIPDDCRYVIGTVGMLRPDRQPWLYLSIFAEIAKTFGSEAHFILAGAGSEYNQLQLLAKEYGLDNLVHFPGLILEPRIPLSVMDLYLTINVGAVTGIAALEAAYMSIPVCAIQLRSNYTVTPNDWIWSSSILSEVANKAIEILKNPAYWHSLGEQQASHVRDYHTVEAMVCSYDSLYQTAIKR